MITINDNLNNKSPKSLDDKRGVFQSGAWRAYNSKAEVLSKVPLAYRYLTMEVDISIYGVTQTYWFRDAVTLESDLILKVNIDSAPMITANQSSLDGNNNDGYYLTLTGGESLPIGYTIAPNAIVDKSGVLSYPPIQLSSDGLYIVGFPDKDTQDITIKLI